MDFLGMQTCDHRVGNPIVAYSLNTCPRCLGKGSYGSLGFDNHGKITLVEKDTQFQQAIKKILITNKMSNGYGFDYTLLAGTIVQATISAVKSEVIRCINYLVSAQAAAEKLGTLYDPKEKVLAINGLTVAQDINEPRKLYITMTVLNYVNQAVTTTVAIQR
jgi:hypothetical protein